MAAGLGLCPGGFLALGLRFPVALGGSPRRYPPAAGFGGPWPCGWTVPARLEVAGQPEPPPSGPWFQAPHSTAPGLLHPHRPPRPQGASCPITGAGAKGSRALSRPSRTAGDHLPHAALNLSLGRSPVKRTDPPNSGAQPNSTPRPHLTQGLSTWHMALLADPRPRPRADRSRERTRWGSLYWGAGTRVRVL